MLASHRHVQWLLNKFPFAVLKYEIMQKWYFIYHNLVMFVFAQFKPTLQNHNNGTGLDAL